MHFPFAIDPNIFTTWQTYSYIVQDCGVQHGRLIADFPNSWRKMVLAVAAQNLAGKPETNLEYTRIEYKLQHEMADKLVVRHGAYNHQNNDWLAQAEKEHVRQPFRAIVSSANPRSVPRVLKVSFLDKEGDPHWRVDPYLHVDREALALANPPRTLFGISKKVKFVDPHFGLELPRFRGSLNAFLAAIRAMNPSLVEVEYHCQKKSTAEFFQNQINNPPTPQSLNVPRGIRLRFVRWKQMSGGDKIHPRYILTDRGGLAYEVGLDVGNAGEKTKIYRMSEKEREETWRQYDTNPLDPLGKPCATCFEFVDEFIVSGT